jgi:hypothetical protein
LNSKNQKIYIHNGSQIVLKNVTSLIVKTISELESRVKNYRGKTKKQKEGSACMHACIRWEGDGGGHVAGWLALRGMEVGTWLVGWLG